MPDANKLQGVNDPAGLRPVPGEIPEGVQLGDDQMEAGDGEEPQEPEEPLDPYEIILQGFRTICQTLSAAYGAASAEIHIIVRKAWQKPPLKTGPSYGEPPGPFVTGETPSGWQWPVQRKAPRSKPNYWQRLGRWGRMSSIPFLPKLTPVFSRATHLLALALAVARQYTNDALRNIHTQLVDLAKEHVPQEQAGAFFNTILQVTCSFRQEMDNMATNQVFLPSQIVPNLWGSHRGLLEGLSLLGPPSCLASWPASLVEWVTAVPACQNMPGLSKTLTKSNLPLSTGIFWGDEVRGKEDAEACKLEEKCWKKSTGPVLSLGDHEGSITNLMK